MTPIPNFLFTSESVTEGHPDKIADQISDAVLDAVITEDPHGRVACETLADHRPGGGSGEITTAAARGLRRDRPRSGARRWLYALLITDSTAERTAMIFAIKRQCPDIAMGVDTGGAGDQGLMFGFACDETERADALPIELAHKSVTRGSRKSAARIG